MSSADPKSISRLWWLAIVPLVVEGRIEEEPLVLELEVLVLLANSALAKREQLLTLGESADGYSPFL